MECRYIKSEKSIGTIIVFHGYRGEKSTMVDKANEFLLLGYNKLLVGFIGCENSEGYKTTFGFQESFEVKTTYDYIQQNREKNLYLFGTSMGAVAIRKAINDYHLQPKGILLEFPFGTMYQTIAARFHIMKIPAFPMTGIV